MKNVLCFVFLLTFALVLSHRDAQKRGGLLSRPRERPEVTVQSTKNALANLVNAGVPIYPPQPSDECFTDIANTKIVDQTKGIVFYNFGQTTCYIVGKADFQVSLLSKTEPNVPTGSAQCADRPEFQAVYLHFYPNADTYMILNPTVAPWFFTAPLTGCDMFVAANPNQPKQPIVVHNNRNNCVNNVANLREKGKSVDRLVGSMESDYPNYKLVARWYYEPKPDEKMEAGQYLNEYEVIHPGIKLITYSAESQTTPDNHFIGYYYNGKWNFIVKRQHDGKTTPVFSL